MLVSGRFTSDPTISQNNCQGGVRLVLDEDRRCFSLHWPKVRREVPRGPPPYGKSPFLKPCLLWVFIGYHPQESLGTQNLPGYTVKGTPKCPLSNPFIPLATSNLVFTVTH